MRARVLPVAEWDRLPNKALASLLRTMNPADVDAIVVEDGDKIVACWGVCRMTHLEGLWIDPEHKTAAIRLIKAASEVVGEDPWVVTSAETPEVRDMIKRFGGEQVPVDTFVLSLKRRVA